MIKKMSFLKKIFGSYSDKEVARLIPIVDKIEALQPSVDNLSDDDLKAKTPEFRERLAKGETLDDLLPEAFAVVRSATTRVLNQTQFRVQLIGGIIMHQGRIAEMRTGEGKTHTSALTAYLNALPGKGVHVVTVNDYLAKRDSEWMGEIHRFLGLKVGCILHDMSPPERREAYNCDITYATNNELGFDYLRDNMVVYQEDQVQRGLNFTIIDEIDSILIDEARTPLIISGASGKATNLYKIADTFVRKLKKGRIVNEEEAFNPILRAEIQEEGDFVVDEKHKTVSLTQEGVMKAEQFFVIDNLSDAHNLDKQHHINNALKAHYTMSRDTDYVVKDGNEIVIVDEFTGRMMPGRRYSDGLHQAIEAKEGLNVQRESKTLATITFQNFFNRYTKKSGMTGTALTEESEFREIYKMDVVAVPTNKPIARVDQPDSVYKTAEGKIRAIIADIKECHGRGQPVLVGTVSIEKSELLSERLRKMGIKHKVLNAKHHESEAEIVADAGLKGAITIATNMAGRGTDIKLGEDVVELGGLKIIGTERHESRRIDNQLRGRSGRQGDPGESRFYIALEDDLMRLFAGDRVKRMMNTLGMEEDDSIDSKMLSKAIEGAQKKVEGNHFSTRKNLMDYDRIMNDQREIIYAERGKVLSGSNLKDSIMGMIGEIISRAVDLYTDEETGVVDIVRLNVHIEPIFRMTYPTDKSENTDTLKANITENAKALYEKREQEFSLIEALDIRELERNFMLRAVDQKWMDHIDAMDQMRQGIMLHSIAQRDPLMEYRFLSYEMFEELSHNIQTETVRRMFNVRFETRPLNREQVAKGMSTNKDESMTKKPTTRKEAKIGNNEPCPCGSGLKYKKCCKTKNA